MRILHTGDWHLGDRLGAVDRTGDLRRAVERVAGYCRERDVEVLLVAGDLFSERSRAEGLRDSVAHLHEVFRPFLTRGGTVVAITGNHDSETFCRTLGHAMGLAAPEPGQPGATVAPGRFYLAGGPTFFRLRGRAGEAVQFVLMPYPTEHRYLDGDSQNYTSVEEKHRALQAAYAGRLRAIRQDPAFDASLPTVLSMHVHVRGAALLRGFRITEQEDVLLPEGELPVGWAYVALGHIHQAQALMGLPHVRYCGSIERLDLGERDDAKSVALVEVGPGGLAGEPELLPLDATPFFDVVLNDPRAELPRLRERFADRPDALVRCQINFRAGTDDLNAVLKELRSLFPRCYQLHWTDVSRPDAAPDGLPSAPVSLRDTVVDYLQTQLGEHPEWESVRQLAEALVVEEA